ncbi:hypothetical protein [Corynebacterium sp. J010B-136]|uniref:hypothetical protein n=1 Tax=Corynebacterium sp. J010B-136 TaxID=2099401 RepID=UPI000CF9FC64|nr:hypothetical protein [Corynebacterium sp. J010B-136]PQM74675.1 hypothetical protein C5Y44_07245 [Corynebacterium sp. J010B-136]
MKLFSRKALVAGAAAVALSFAGTSVAAAEEGDNTEVVTPAPGATDDTVNEGGEGNDANEGGDDEGQDNNNGNGGSSSKDDEKNEGEDKDEDNGLSSQDPKDISAWISVFTAVIGALGALFAFASKYLGFKL